MTKPKKTKKTATKESSVTKNVLSKIPKDAVKFVVPASPESDKKFKALVKKLDKGAPKRPRKCVITIIDDKKSGAKVSFKFTPDLPAVAGTLTDAQALAMSLLSLAKDILGTPATEESK
jgi:hypothetical protein